MDKQAVLLAAAAAAVIVLVLIYVAQQKKSKEGLYCGGSNVNNPVCQEELRRQYNTYSSYNVPRTQLNLADQIWNQLIQQKQLQPTKEGLTCKGMSKQACQAEAQRQYHANNQPYLPNSAFLPARPVAAELSWNSLPTSPSF